MASTTQTVTVPAAAASSSDAAAASPQCFSWEGIGHLEWWFQLSYWFGQVKVPHPQWARKFYDAGYADMDDLKATDVNLDAVFTEMSVPSGIHAKIRNAVQ